MTIADRRTYLADIIATLHRPWPGNRTVNIVCHGHSVPAGYFATPMVDTFNAYPHLFHHGLKHRFPFAVINVIVTAIGGENSLSGEQRFEAEVLNHRPDVITVDYGLNDRHLGLTPARTAWTSMIQKAQSKNVKVLLLTPTGDSTQQADVSAEERQELQQQAEQIRHLAVKHEIGLVDSLAAFEQYQETGDLSDLLSWRNHPNRDGHDLVARELLRWFPLG